VDATESNKPPQYTDIRLSNIYIEGGGGGAIGVDGLDAAHRLSLTFHNVVVEHPETARTSAHHAAIEVDGSNISFAGDDVTLTGAPSKAVAINCDGRFVPFPVPVSLQ
jgi:hypothetical protein